MIDTRVEKIRKNVEEIMDILEIKVTESNEDTPLRIAKMYVNELFKNRNNKNLDDLKAQMKMFENVGSDEMVVIKDIEFTSVCEHHWLPFIGKIHFAYIPGDSIIGLSKVPRVVEYFSQKPQLQENLVKEIGEFLEDEIQPEAIFIYAEGMHECVLCRGVKKDCLTNTVYTGGINSDAYYNEFLARALT